MSSEARTETSWFEAFQFGVTRVIAILLALVAWLAISGIIIFFVIMRTGSGTHVSLADIQPITVVNSPSSAPTADGSLGNGYKMPQNLADFFSGDNKGVLDGWFENLENDQKQDFLDNLSRLVAESPKGLSADTINKYKDIKLKKLDNSPFAKYQRIGEIAGGIAVIIAALFLVILTSLVLVLLAIERNTRKVIQAGPSLKDA